MMARPGTTNAKRQRYALRWIVGAAMVATTLAVGFHPVEFDVAPLCAMEVAGAPNGINAAATDALAHADAVLDSLTTADHQFEFPAGFNRAATIRLPWAMHVHRILVMGWGEQQSASLHVRFEGARTEEDEPPRPWRAIDGVPPMAQLQPKLPVRSFAMSFTGAERVVLNNVSVFVAWPRCLAVACWLAINVVGPWLFGFGWLIAAIGLGGLIVTVLNQRPDLASAAVVGLAASAAAAAILAGWSTSSLAAGFVGLLSFVGLLAAILSAFHSRFAIAAWDGRLLRRIAMLALLLAAAVAVETHLVRGNRVTPYDHLMPLFGARRLAAGLAVPADLAARPWLLHVLFVPLEMVAGRFSYPIYLGFMAALNASSLLAIDAVAKRLRPDAGMGVAATVAAMPAIVCLHFFGQRPLSGGLMLFALVWWLGSRTDRRPMLAGLAAALAILAHPGALFVLPGIIVWMSFSIYREAREGDAKRVTVLLLSIILPMATYGCWMAFVRWQYPDFRNALTMYPLLASLEGPLPVGSDLLDAARRLSIGQWQTLVLNRARQLVDYLWSPSARDLVVELFRPISLANCLGWSGLALLFRSANGNADRSLLTCGIVAPLLVHHLYIGQAAAQFHISPLPFLLLATMAAANPDWLRQRGSRIAMLARVEWGLRICWPCLLLGFGSLGWWKSPIHGPTPFANDAIAVHCCAAILPAVWLAIAIPGGPWTNGERGDDNVQG